MLEKPKIYIIILNKNKYLHDMIQIIESQIRKTRIITFKFHVLLNSKCSVKPPQTENTNRTKSLFTKNFSHPFKIGQWLEFLFV